MMISLLLLALVAGQQSPPPSPVEYDPPSRSTVSTVHSCPGQRLELDYQVRGWTSGERSGVTVTRYRSSAGTMSRSQISAWNRELGRIRQFRYLQVECQTGDRVAVLVAGGDGSGAEARVQAFVDRGRVRFARPPSP